MGLIRDKVDMAGAVSDLRRAAQAGGPKKIARWWGRPRGADRFPAKPIRRSSSSKRG